MQENRNIVQSTHIHTDWDTHTHPNYINWIAYTSIYIYTIGLDRYIAVVVVVLCRRIKMNEAKIIIYESYKLIVKNQKEEEEETTKDLPRDVDIKRIKVVTIVRAIILMEMFNLTDYSIDKCLQ